ncbi:MAG: stage II sporulation protein R [Firmicutes bacterium]|nr:stage II sporulation protein R [Bacillota bacterium]
MLRHRSRPGRGRALTGRIAVALAMAVAALALVSVWRAARPYVTHAYNTIPVFRLHVVAHSNAPDDQEMKLQVRDAVLPIVLQLAQGAQSAEEVHRRVLAERERIEAAALGRLRALGETHGVRIESESGPDGAPLAVRVIIGAGQGRNWFCVLFPPLCFAGGGEAVQASPHVPPPEEGIRAAIPWLDWLPGLSSMLLGSLGEVNEDHVHTDLAHALPGDGDVGPTAE